MIDAPPIPDLDFALRLVDSVQNHPQRARDEAEVLIARQDLEPETAAVAWWAFGFASRQLNDLATADRALRRGIDIAASAGLAQRVGQIRSSLALVLLYKGESQGALEEAEQAMVGLAGVDRARNRDANRVDPATSGSS